MATHAHAKGEKGNKWTRQPDGLFHCTVCGYTHERAASVGRHALSHSHSKTSGAQRKRDYAKEYYQRHQGAIRAQQIIRAKLRNDKEYKEITHVNGSNSHASDQEHEIDKTVYFLTGGWAKDLQGASRSLDCSLGELTERCIKVLRATNVR